MEGRGDSRSDTRSGALGLGDARDTHKERPPLVSRGGDRHEGRGGRGGRTGGLDDQGRHGSYSGRQDSAQKSSREVSVPTPARPKLNLMPRSIPLDQVAAPIGDPTIFGVGKARVALEVISPCCFTEMTYLLFASLSISLVMYLHISLPRRIPSP